MMMKYTVKNTTEGQPLSVCGRDTRGVGSAGHEAARCPKTLRAIPRLLRSFVRCGGEVVGVAKAR